MPFIISRVNVSISREQEIELKTQLGKAIELVPGKSEAYLLLSFRRKGEDLPMTPSTFLLQFDVILVRNRLQPLIGGVFAADLNGQVGEPAIRSRAVPVLDLGRNVDHGAWVIGTASLPHS